MAFVSTARVKQQILNFDDADDIILKDILDGVLQFVKNYCRQSLELTAYREQHDASGRGFFQLRERPVNNIVRVAVAGAVLQIQNTTASRATVSIDDTGVTLQSATAGVAASETKLFADHVTLTAMASAIDAEAGWTCSVVNDYGNHESNTLAKAVGVPCLSQTQLAGYVTDVIFVFQHPATIVIANGIGFATTRVDYTAGYAVCPDDLAQCISEWCQIVYKARNVDPNFASYSNGAYSWSRGIANGFDQLSAPSRSTLQRYRVTRLTGGHLI